MNSHPVVIVPAHMGSSRLPGKVLKRIGEKTVLAHVIERIRRCPRVGTVVVATSTMSDDDRIVSACDQIGVPCVRGSDEDVLDRFMVAAEAYPSEAYVRITSDCPLTDPVVTGHVIDSFLNADPPVDYASNKFPQSYPRGLDAEVFTQSALRRAWEQARESYERRHVTIYMYEHPENFKLLSVVDDIDRADWRWTLDTTEDLAFIKEVYRRLGEDGAFGWRDIIQLLEQHPELLAINAHVEQKPVKEG